MTAGQITLEMMAPGHLEGAVELSRQVKWPHRREDWSEWLTSRGLTHVGGGITMPRITDAQEHKRTAPRRIYALVSQALG
jgi:hypothetical protein